MQSSEADLRAMDPMFITSAYSRGTSNLKSVDMIACMAWVLFLNFDRLAEMAYANATVLPSGIQTALCRSDS